ncbi:MAG: hypothetical protein AB1758_34370 [Candidatus Eremiobacterota bacterium]
MTRRGATLAEAVLASFILLAGFLVLFNLFHAALRYGTWVEHQSLATLVAEKTLDELRAWSQDSSGGGFNYDGSWSTYDGVTFTDPDYPEFQVTVQVQPGTRPLDVPSSTLEAPHAPDLRRMPSAVIPVEVEVRWDPLDPTRNVRLVSYIGEPPRRFRATNPLVVTPVGGVPNPVPRDAPVGFQVRAFDAQDRELENTMFTWAVVPVGTGPTGVPGNGTLVPGTRNGRSVTFQNRYQNPSGAWIHTGGECVVRVQARCGPDLLTQDSQVLVLQP